MTSERNDGLKRYGVAIWMLGSALYVTARCLPIQTGVRFVMRVMNWFADTSLGNRAGVAELKRRGGLKQ